MLPGAVTPWPPCARTLDAYPDAIALTRTVADFFIVISFYLEVSCYEHKPIRSWFRRSTPSPDQVPARPQFPIAASDRPQNCKLQRQVTPIFWRLTVALRLARVPYVSNHKQQALGKARDCGPHPA